MKISQLDHLVLTVADIDATCDFYGRALGMKRIAFGNGRSALVFGQQKINLHRHGQEFEPKAHRPTPGSADLCFLSDTPLEQVITHLETEQITLIEGPVDRTGATGPIRSVYVRDPDGNLIEIANRMEEPGNE
ncbi:VOC family protein [Salinicola lusitanus]|uniref:VOC family protein n=1 Tax=Salinicola lusitanus TaxID=1949085 RepID=UPI000DA13163|nr:VOC family protein [Salinicola lusitanus]